MQTAGYKFVDKPVPYGQLSAATMLSTATTPLAVAAALGRGPAGPRGKARREKCPLCLARRPRSTQKRFTEEGLRKHLLIKHQEDLRTGGQLPRDERAPAAAAGGDGSKHDLIEILRTTFREEDLGGSSAAAAASEPGSADTSSCSLAKRQRTRGGDAANNTTTGAKSGTATSAAAAAKASQARPALHPGLAAARDGDLATLRRLVEEGASATAGSAAGAAPTTTSGHWDIESTTDRHGSNALCWASGSGHLDVVLYLLDECGLDPTKVVLKGRRDGKAPLHWAARNDRHEVVAELLGRGVPVDMPAKDGTTPLHLACYTGARRAAEALLAAGADLAARNRYACGVEHWASMGGHVPMARWLAGKHGVRFEAAQGQGQTPLHKAAMKGHEEMVAFLTQHLAAAAGAGGRDEAEEEKGKAAAAAAAGDDDEDEDDDDGETAGEQVTVLDRRNADGLSASQVMASLKRKR